MSFQPSEYSFPKGASATSADMWMRKVYTHPKSEDDGQHQSGHEPDLKPLEGPNPWSTVALVSAKQGVDQLARLEREPARRHPIIEGIVVVGHIALGVAAFEVLIWTMSTLAAGVEQSLTAKSRRVQGERDAATAT